MRGSGTSIDRIQTPRTHHRRRPGHSHDHAPERRSLLPNAERRKENGSDRGAGTMAVVVPVDGVSGVADHACSDAQPRYHGVGTSTAHREGICPCGRVWR